MKRNSVKPSEDVSPAQQNYNFQEPVKANKDMQPSRSITPEAWSERSVSTGHPEGT